MATIPNEPATIAPAAGSQNIKIGHALAAAGLFSATDANGDAIEAYQLYDPTEDGGHWTIDGQAQPGQQFITLTAADLPQVSYTAGESPGTETLWVRAYDGQAWSWWTSWQMVTCVNEAPTVIPAAATQIIAAGDSLAAQSLFSTRDANDDAIGAYQLYDEGPGGGSWRIDGQAQPGQHFITVSAAELSTAEYVGGPGPGTEAVWVRAYDGDAWSWWTSWQMATVEPQTM
jgi:hypothetical protein